MAEPDKLEKVAIAREQLARVQVAWFDPVDWSDLSLYAFYAIENAVSAAADHLGVEWKATHPSKVEAARKLHSDHGLPDVADLLEELNRLRKAHAYGEAERRTSWGAEDIAIGTEEFVEATARLIEEAEDEAEEAEHEENEDDEG